MAEENKTPGTKRSPRTKKPPTAQSEINQEEHEDPTLVHLEPVKDIEVETKNIVSTSKTLIFVVVGILAYLTFMIIPDINDKVDWVAKDLNAVLTQSERYKLATRVFSRDNVCASCHLDPDFLLHGLQSKYPSFSDLKAFMRIGHERYYTMTTPIDDQYLMDIYRTLK